MDEAEQITLFADFDSANMARYERVLNKSQNQNQLMALSTNNFLDDRSPTGLYDWLY